MNYILHFSISNHVLLHIVVLGFASFVLSMLITPLFTTVAYKYKWWKRPRTDAWSGGQATVYAKLHADKHKRNIPTMAGLIFIISISIVTLVANLHRAQTWLPLAGMLGAGLIGLVDDVMNIRGNSLIAGMKAKVKFLLYSLVALVGGWWFYAKLGKTSIYLPIVHNWQLGIFIIPVNRWIRWFSRRSVNFIIYGLRRYCVCTGQV